MKVTGKSLILNLDVLQKTKNAKKQGNVKKSKTNNVVPNKRQVLTREHVQISRQAQELQRLKQNVSQLPSVRKEKVAQTKRAIAQGSYQVNSKATATKLLHNGLINKIYSR